MKAVMVMYDSLRLDALPSYGGRKIELPNFKRLEQHAVTFDTSYVCSLPCMPARRELHTGRPNFLHREWGPMEPFDDSMPEILKRRGIYTRLVTDHQHYVEDGGGTYHPRYSTWECNRGQEGDPWAGNADRTLRQSPHTLRKLKDIPVPDSVKPFFNSLNGQDLFNRERIKTKEDYPQSKTFSQGVEFIENNLGEDNWFIQIETFDPHEPFNAPKDHIARLFDPDNVSELDWPPYSPLNDTDTQEVIDDIRNKYLALVSFCDESLGRVLDLFDKHDLWKDTLLIVNTDHGYLLGEHGWWAKTMMPDYNEIAHTPLFIWDPRCGVKGERRSSLVQTIDLAPTILDFFGVEIPKDMQGKPLKDVIAGDKPVRECGMFGSFGGILSVTDGRYIYMIAPKENYPVHDYTLVTTQMRSRMPVEMLQNTSLREPFSFTKGCPVLSIPANVKRMAPDLPHGETMLFDVIADPKQTTRLDDPAVVARLRKALVQLMKENDAPGEMYDCYGLADEK